jgi:hypothetical protein
MDDFIARMGLRGALQLYLFLARQEDELEGGVVEFCAALRAYLYDHLSIEDMESPETLLAKLDER